MVIYHSPAKINLTLDIVGTRPDGYHKLQSVVACIGLYDDLQFQFRMPEPPLLRFKCDDPVLETSENLCVRAAKGYLGEWENVGSVSGVTGEHTWAGAQITLNKNIPMGAGLGGGSSNAATVLRAFFDKYDRSLDSDALRRVAARLGADVPLFLYGGCLLMEGVGEKLKRLQPIEGAVVIIAPPQHASTPAVYKRFDELNVASQRRTKDMLAAVAKGNIHEVAACLGNDLQNAAASLGIDVERPIQLLKAHGALGAQMSGSGAASFGLFPDMEKATAAAKNLREDVSLPEDYRVYAAPLLAGGIERI